jgi:hypothetical protein
MYSKVCIGEYLSHNFPIQSGLNQGNSLSPSTFEYAIRKDQENQVGPQSSGTHQLLTHADHVNLWEKTQIL